MNSAGLLSTSWPWPYPPVDLPFPEFKMNRSDPGVFEDGSGAHLVNLMGADSALINYREFGDVIPEAVRGGLKL